MPALSDRPAIEPSVDLRRVLAALAIALLCWSQPGSGAAAGDNAGAAETDVVVSRGQEAYRRGDFAEAITLWRRAAEAGSVAAQNELGLVFETGRGSPRDNGEALKWYRLAAEQGDPTALTSVGSMLEKGQGAARDYETASRLFRQAADRGYAPAMTDLAEMYEKGEGTARDFVAARKWYEEAWDRGADKWAAYRLGQIYENGFGVEKNDAVAGFWNALASSRAAMCG
jgi:uncharacterized protein